MTASAQRLMNPHRGGLCRNAGSGILRGSVETSMDMLHHEL